MPDNTNKRKSRGGSRENEKGDGDDGTNDNDDKNSLSEMQAWLDTVPLISVAPAKQVSVDRGWSRESARVEREREKKKKKRKGEKGRVKLSKSR
jgi:hypothetical protein